MSQDNKPNYVAEAGAPEVEITPEMIEAATGCLQDSLGDLPISDASFRRIAEEVLNRAFRASYLVEGKRAG